MAYFDERGVLQVSYYCPACESSFTVSRIPLGDSLEGPSGSLDEDVCCPGCGDCEQVRINPEDAWDLAGHGGGDSARLLGEAPRR